MEPTPEKLRREMRELKYALDELKDYCLKNTSRLPPEVMTIFEKLCSPSALHKQITTILPLNKQGNLICPRCRKVLVLKKKPRKVERKRKRLPPPPSKVKQSKGSFFEYLASVDTRKSK